MAEKPNIDELTLRTMRALLQASPKRHNEMKLGKPRGKKAKSLLQPPRQKKQK